MSRELRRLERIGEVLPTYEEWRSSVTAAEAAHLTGALADPKGRGYPMFVDEPLHCARTLYAVLLSLWGARLEREAVDKDAARYRFLQGLHRVRAQAYWWNYSSRRERNKAIDKAILEAAANNVSSTYSIEKP